jgi:hypothetical protein
MPDDFWSTSSSSCWNAQLRSSNARRPFPEILRFWPRRKPEFFLYGPKAASPINKRLEVDWGGNFGGFVEQLKNFSPTWA